MNRRNQKSLFMTYPARPWFGLMRTQREINGLGGPLGIRQLSTTDDGAAAGTRAAGNRLLSRRSTAINRLEGTVSPLVTSVEDFDGCCEIHYDSSEQTLRLSGRDAPITYNPITEERGPRPRPQFGDGMLRGMTYNFIDGQSGGSVYKIKFPNGKVCYTLIARRGAECQALRELHAELMIVDKEGANRLIKESHESGGSNWARDRLGGGMYKSFGYGIRGKPKSIKGSKMPFVMNVHKTEEGRTFTRLFNRVWKKLAPVLLKYCPKEFCANQDLMAEMDNRGVYPPAEHRPGNLLVLHADRFEAAGG